MRLRLRTRVTLAFALLSLVVAGTVAISTYAFASWYLIGQRESSALTRAALDSRAVAAYLDAGLSPSDALTQIPSTPRPDWSTTKPSRLSPADSSIRTSEAPESPTSTSTVFPA